jgi:predicted transcriptional regulator
MRRRREAVEVLRSRGRTPQAIANRLGVTKAAVGNWVNR